MMSSTAYSASGNNFGHFSNAEFDSLVEEAAREVDPDKRKELYKRAETILSEEVAALAPIYHYTRVTLTKPYVDRTVAKTKKSRRNGKLHLGRAQ